MVSNEASKAEEAAASGAGDTLSFLTVAAAAGGELTLQGGPGSLKTQHCPWCFLLPTRSPPSQAPA